MRVIVNFIYVEGHRFELVYSDSLHVQFVTLKNEVSCRTFDGPEVFKSRENVNECDLL